MSDVEKRWIPVVRSLARDMDPDDYIYGPNRAPSERPRSGGPPWRTLLLCVLCVLCGALLAITAETWAGFRRLSADDERALRVVHEIDPGHEVSTDEELARRWGLQAEAFRVVRSAVASEPTGQEYPYLASLAGMPSPAVSPGSGHAIVLLANALDLYEPADQGRMIQRMLAIAASMDRWGVMTALWQLANLAPPVRDRLVANRGATFSHLVEVAEAAVDENAVIHRLGAELREAENRRVDLTRKLEDTVKATAEGEQACARSIRNAQACVARNAPNLPP